MFDKLLMAAAQPVAATDSDQYIANTELLLKGEGTNGQTNSTFVDSSASSHSISRTGDVTQGSFSPFSPKGWSGYFSRSSSDYLQTASSNDFNFGTGDFTVDVWVYPQDINTTDNNGNYTIWDFRSTQTNNFVGLIHHSTNTFRFSNGSSSIVSTTVAQNNQWYHLAFTRESGTCKLYVNGVLEASGSSISINVTANGGAEIGRNYSPASYFNGYISNLRVVTGTALYTSNFTPPTEPLTAVTNTKLLTLQDNRFIDNSASNHSITVNGDTAIKPTSPFSGDRTYPKASYFSGKFDGSNDYLDVSPAATNTYFNFPAGGFNSSSLSGFTHGPGSTSSSQVAGPANGYYVFTNAQGSSGGYIVDNTARQYNKDFSIKFRMAPQGNHFPDGFCMSLNSNSSTIGSRGVMIPPANGGRQVFFYVINWFGPQPPYQTLHMFEETTGTANQIGYADSGFTGGSAPLSTSGFFGGTQYWWWDYEHSTGTHKIYHSTSSTKPSTPRVTATFTMPSTAMHAYIGGGTGGSNTEWRLLEWSAEAPSPNADDFAFGSGDFTYDAWIYPTSFSGGSKRIFYPSANADSLTMGGNSTSYGAGTLSYWTGSSQLTSTTGAISANQWTHVAVTRNGSTVRIFVNGSLNASGTVSAANNTSSGTTMRIGGNPSDSTYFNGYISNARVVKGTCLYTTTFTPSTAPLTPVTNTKLLTLQDNYLVDHSPSGHSITNNGGVTLVPESPFDNSTYPLSGTFYSGYFNGTSDNLTISDSADFDFGSGDFTVEGWVKPLSNNDTMYFGQWVGLAWFFGVSNGTLQFSSYSGGNYYVENSGVSASTYYNKWTHIAATREGNTLRIFVNGEKKGGDHTISHTFNNSSGNFEIGANSETSPTQYYNGYISNVRIVKGTALYTTDFTVPSEPLTAVSGTTLLTLQDATIQDNSASSHSITNNGATVTEIAPFGAELIDRAGSMYFDGTTSDYLQTPSSTDFSPGTGDWTFECWVYLTSYPSDKWGRLWFPDNDRDNIDIAGTNTTHSGGVGSVVLNRGGGTLNTSDVLPLNQWVHVAVVRYNNTSAKIFFNGVEKASSTSFTNPNITASRSVYIGANGGTGSNVGIPGYISNVRYVREALYTSAFTPPTAPLQPITNTKLLLSGNNGGVEDSLGKVTLETNGAQIDTSVKKFGTGSIVFDGTNDYLRCKRGTFNLVGGGDFTVEAWINMDSFASGSYLKVITAEYEQLTGNEGWILSVEGSGNLAFHWLPYSNSVPFMSATGGQISLNTWHHIAVSKAGSNFALFVDGQRVATGSNSGTATDTAIFTVGFYGNNSNAWSQNSWLDGYIDDLRITKGVARYDPTQTSHTVPTKTHPTV